MTINITSSPYYDDFDENKKFYKILFKPGVAVQARELTQIQSQIQNQIKKFGDNVFQNGTVILGAERFFESNLTSVKINSSFGASDVDVTTFNGKTIVGATSGTQAVVKQVATYISGTSPKTLIIKIISGSGFVLGENISYNDGVTIGNATIQVTNAFSDAMLFSINSGVFYINGNFIRNEAQSVIVDAYSNSSSKLIGFNVVESIVDSDLDDSLLDLSQGSPNFSAPGADRYKIDLQLASVDIATNVSINFIGIAKVINGVLTKNETKTLYAELGKELARRTFDNSGNYTVRPFPISFKNHLGSAKARPSITTGVITGISLSSGGVGYTSTPAVTIIGDGTGAIITSTIDSNPTSPTYQQVVSLNIVNGGTGYTLANTSILIDGDVNKLTVTLDSGKAYVKGFEFETTSQTYLSLDRARTTQSSNNIDSLVSYGNLINVNNAFGAVDPSLFTTVELHSVVRASIVDATTLIGTASVRLLKYVSGTVGTPSCVYKLSLFDIFINSGKLFKNIQSIVLRSGAVVTAGYDVDLSSKFGNVANGYVLLSGTDQATLVFPLNNSYIKTLRDTLNNSQNYYSFRRTFNNVVFSGGSATISTNNGLEIFHGGFGAYADNIKDTFYHVVVTSVGTSTFTVGQVLRFNTAGSRSITGGSVVPSTPHQLTFNVGASVGFTASIIAEIDATGQLEKTKALQGYTTKGISTPNTIIGGRDDIGISDINNVIAIYNTGNVNPAGQVGIDPNTGAVTTWGTITSYTDVTKNYIVDNGQRDDYYDHGSIILNGVAPASTNYLVVVYNYFTHSGNGFLSVASYGIPYQNIPVYTSPITGIVYNLRDCIDFRPRKADNTTTLSNAQLPDPDFSFNSTYQYYVGRIDKIIATSGKTFITKQGIPSQIPSAPSDEFDGMNLYILEIPPYTANLQEISVKYIENKRYTMRDIGKLESRINNLEYYTQLSVLEAQAQNQFIPDGASLNKFKNGFFADPFTSNNTLFNINNPSSWNKQIWGWWNYRRSSTLTWNKGASRLYSTSVSDSDNVDYKAAIDPFAGELRASFNVYNLSFSPSSFTNTTRADDLVTLAYTERNYISQQFASLTLNVNPYNIISFNGNIKLTPPNDVWVDTNVLPVSNRIANVQVPNANPADNITKVFTGRAALHKNILTSVITNSNVLAQTTTSLGNQVTDIQYVPYMRASNISVQCLGFKPLARLYPFLNNNILSAISKPNTTILTNNHVGNLFSSNANTIGQSEIVSFRTGSITGTVIGTAYVRYYSPQSLSVAGQRTLQISDVITGTTSGATFVTGSSGNSASIISTTNYNFADPILPDNFGNTSFTIKIPAATYLTGDNTIRLIDNIDNNVSSNASIGESKYYTQGTLISTQETILTTRTIQNQVINNITSFYYDPLAQSFLVDSKANPNGVHINSIDLYFKTKSTNVPVAVEIRRVINGLPESAITSIPFATVNKNAEDVLTSFTGSIATNFKLQAPVHLIPGEYAFIVKSNCTDYQVFVAEIGKVDILSNQIISKQPSTGVMFKSQNASTWTPVQEQNIKFNINSAVFNTSGSVQFAVNDNLSYTIAGNTTNTSPIVTITNTSKLSVGDYVYGAGILVGARVLTVDSSTQFTMDTNATATGTITITVIPYLKYQSLNIGSSSIVPTGGSLNWSIKVLDDATGLMDTNFSTFITDVDFDRSAFAGIKPLAQNSNIPSIIIQANLSTTDTNISPFIDISGLSATLARNVINTTDISITDGEQVAMGGDALARYISKKITLANNFDSSNIVCTLNMYRPSGTDVRVYYKVLATESNAVFNTQPWVRMLPESSSFSGSITDIKEVKYYPQNAFGAYGIPLDNPISPRFNTYAIKIVLVSNNGAITPKVKSLVSIALDT